MSHQQSTPLPTALPIAASACAAMLVLGARAGAQERLPADTSAVLPPVMVTAERSVAPLLTTPLAVTTVKGEALQATRGVGLEDALRFVPGVVAQSRYGTSDVRIVIRGFGARGAGDRSNAGTSRGVRVLVDGIPETEPDGRTAFDQIDLASTERVEVVRSNASALYGNAAGGVVNVRTVPSARRPRATAGLSGGSFGLRRAVLQAASPIGGDGVGYLAFTNTSWEGWRAHSSSRRTTVNAGASGGLGEATRTSLLLSGANNLLHVPGPLTAAQLRADPRQANAVYASRDERRHNRVARLGATVEHDADSLTAFAAMLFVNPKRLLRSERNTYREFERYHVGGSVLVRREFPLAGRIRLSTVAGADKALQDGDIRFFSLTPRGTKGESLVDDKREAANNVGVFTQLELRHAERLQLTVGARYDAVRYEYESFVGERIGGARTFSRISPKIGAALVVGDGKSVYGNVGGGIEVPAGNETDPAGTYGQDTVYAINPLLDAIRSTTWELGYRALDDGASTFGVAYDVALYTTDVRNEIVPYRGGRFYFTAGRARRSGAELGLTARAPNATTLRAALTLSRNRYVRYLVDSVHYGRPEASDADYSGNQVVGVPSVVANADVGMAVPGLPFLVARLGVEYMGRYYLDDANRTAVTPAAVLSATLEVRDHLFARNGVGVRGFLTVQNLANRTYVGSAFLNPDVVGGEPVAYEPGAPRSLVLSLSVGRLD